MLSIDKMSQIPIYKQIESGVNELIPSGLLNPGDRLPSVRALLCSSTSTRAPFRKYILSLTASGQ